MRRRAVVGAGAVLALAAVAVSSAEESAASDEEAGARPMPDFLDRGLWQVFTGLGRRTRLDVHDVGGRDRRVLWPLSWRVCTQYPSAGTGLDRRTTVMIGVVRKGETCPPRVRTARR
ncbi:MULTISPECIES: hypothetical protein [unclassified Streptomyces]|uniref:hypothetical protein n=1 Tax=unclassified Streptomyces TaxID=2593676 RepID=UPI0016602EB5|nr:MULTISPECIES: hypothetical protein [unclassified Streptomyces]MBD0711993.1 hypothetical protein [Streptomyces sp. CBMA291]MBD0713003.1 hypothetical protein [Streptomyces sp. CBMA370]